MLADFGIFLFNITQFVVYFPPVLLKDLSIKSAFIVQPGLNQHPPASQRVSSGLCELSQIRVSGLRTGLFFSASLMKPQLRVTSCFSCGSFNFKSELFN